MMNAAEFGDDHSFDDPLSSTISFTNGSSSSSTANSSNGSSTVAAAAAPAVAPKQQQQQPSLAIYDEDGLLIKAGTVEAQVEQFRKLFLEGGDMRRLCTKALGGALRKDYNIRSLVWKVFMGVLPAEQFPASVRSSVGAFVLFDAKAWLQQTQEYRARFTQLVQHHFIDPHRAAESAGEEADPSVFNPLAQDESNPWSQFFQQQELERTIQQDLVRLYPEHPFFRTEKVQSIMLRVLYVWSRENADTSYRQGMHELLAPILLVLHRDAKARHEFESSALKFQQNFDDESAEVAKLLEVMLDEQQIEADAFLLFEKLMIAMKDFFRIVERTPSPHSVSTPTSSKSLFRGTEDALFSLSGASPQPAADGSSGGASDPHTRTPIYRICNQIQNVLLKRKDPQLHAYLADMGIEPQIYGLRWVRLLFGREFHLEDVLVLWDALFADCGAFRVNSKDAVAQSPIDLSLVEHIATVMLVFIRSQILSMDHSQVLRRLMKYPPVEDVHVFIEKAMESRNDPECPFVLPAASASSSSSAFDNEVVSKPMTPSRPNRSTQQSTPHKSAHHHHHHQARSISASAGAMPKPKPLPSLFQGNPIGLFASTASNAIFGSTTTSSSSTSMSGSTSLSSSSSSSSQQQRNGGSASTSVQHHQRPLGGLPRLPHHTHHQQKHHSPQPDTRPFADKEIKLGEAMEKLLSNIQRELFEKAEGTHDESTILMSLAKLKHIKDILKFQLELNADELNWISQPVNVQDAESSSATKVAPVPGHPLEQDSQLSVSTSPGNAAPASPTAQDFDDEEDLVGAVAGQDIQLLTPEKQLL